MLTLTLIFLLSACGTPAPANPQGGIEVFAPFVDAAMMVQVMETKMDGDVMSMREAPGIDIPIGIIVELKPGGYHIMLMNLKQELKVNSSISITLEFEKAGRVTLDVPVKMPGSIP